MSNDFNGELLNGITDSVVDLGERVSELERKETLGAGDGIGPFRYELNVDWAGRGDFTSIGAACTYIAAQPTAGVEEWVVWIHAGFYTEDAFTVPDLVTLEGLGGDVQIVMGEFFHEGSVIVAGEFVTMRNLQCTQGLSSNTEAAFVVDAGEGLRLENCKFRATFQGPGSGDVFVTGCVRVTGGNVDFFGCEFSTLAQTDAQWLVVLVDATDSSGTNNIRSCYIFLDPGGAYLANGTGLHFEGNAKSLYLLETTIIPRTTGDPGFDLTVGTGATIYLRATNYNKGNGTITYIYPADSATVSSVDVAVPDFLTTTGGPITSSGTITIGLAEQEPNLVFASPDGMAGEPLFRTLEVDDIPTLPPSKISGTLVTGTGAANQIAIFDDTSNITGDPNLTYNFTDNYLTQAGRMFLGGVTSATGAGAGYVTDAVLELGSDQGAGDTRHASILLMSALQTSVDQIFSGIIWANRSISPAVEKRIAQIVAYTDSTIDRGTLRVMMAPGSNAAPVEAMRFNPERSIWIGDPDSYAFSLAGPGDLEVEGDLQVGGSILATFSTLRTGTGAGNTLLLQAYDVDGASYTTFATLTANNTPTMDLADSVTKGGGYIYRAGGTDVPIADGGTGASTAAVALSNLGGVADTGDTMSGALTITLAGVGPALDVTVADTTTFATVEVTNSGAGAGAGSGILFTADSGYNCTFFQASSTYSGISGAAGKFVINTGATTEGLLFRTSSSAKPITFMQGGTTALGMDLGNVGVGTATPGEDFEVLRTTGGIVRLSRNDTSVAINDMIGKVEWWGDDSDLSTQSVFANIEVQALTAISADVASSKMLFRTVGLGTATSPVERLALGCVKNLTDAATSLFDVTLAAGQMAGGTIQWTIIASNGTDHQAYSGIATYAVVNKAGTYTSQITHDAANDAKAVSSGTLTAAWAILNGASKVTIRVTPTGSLTETTYQIIYSVHSNSPQSITIL